MLDILQLRNYLKSHDSSEERNSTVPKGKRVRKGCEVGQRATFSPQFSPKRR